MDLGLAGKRAIVTGSSRGIGLAVARALAADVADVVAFVASPRSIGIARDAVAVGGGVPGHVYY